MNGEENDYIFSWVNKISNHRRLSRKKRYTTTSRMFSNLLLNASINLNNSDGSVNNHEVSNVGNKCDSIISNILEKNYSHSVRNDKIITSLKKEKLNINSKKSNNNNEPNKNKKYKIPLRENKSEKQQRLNKIANLIKIKPLNNQNFNNKKKLPIEYIRTAKKLKKNNNNSYNEYVKILKDEGKKIIDIVNEIRKLFDKGPVSIKFDDKDIEFPFYEYAKRLNKGFEKIEEIKEEVQKPMKLVMVVLGDQINTVTLDLLFIMDITESMQDLLDETRDSIKYILDKIKRDSPGIDVRFAYEGYRDFADLKEGQKYYTIDFETDLDLFKSKLDEITAIGGGDDAEDVAGGLNAGLNMNWRSNARYAILIADAPGHGNQYHDAEVQDDYGNGDPNGLVLEELMEKYVDNNINLCLTKIDEYTDIMFDRMMQAYKARSEKSQDKPKIEVINYDEEDSNMIDDKNKNQKEKKRTMGNLVAKTAIEIYNHYSQKAEKSANQGAK